MDHPRLFQEVGRDPAAHNRATSIEEDLKKLSESWRVIVSDSFCISKGFQQWIGVDDLPIPLQSTEPA